MSRRSEIRMRAIATARDCAALGARRLTAQLLSGLSEAQLIQLFDGHAPWSQQGRPQHSSDWYFRATVPQQIEASMLMTLFMRLRTGGFDAPQALIGAYQHYRQTFSHTRICFDRAFELVAHLEGRWLTDTALLCVVVCRQCANCYLSAAGTVESSSKACPFCRMRRRCEIDSRIRGGFCLSTSPQQVRERLQALRALFEHTSEPA